MSSLQNLDKYISQNDEFKDLKIEILNYFNNNLVEENKKYIFTVEISITDKDNIYIYFSYRRYFSGGEDPLYDWEDIYIDGYDDFWNNLSKIINITFKTSDLIIDCDDENMFSHHYLLTKYNYDDDLVDYSELLRN